MLNCLQVRISVKKNLFAFENHLQQSLIIIDRRPIAIASYQFF